MKKHIVRIIKDYLDTQVRGFFRYHFGKEAIKSFALRIFKEIEGLFSASVMDGIKRVILDTIHRVLYAAVFTWILEKKIFPILDRLRSRCEKAGIDPNFDDFRVTDVAAYSRTVDYWPNRMRDKKDPMDLDGEAYYDFVFGTDKIKKKESMFMAKLAAQEKAEREAFEKGLAGAAAK